jgi:hypothetical protein
VLVAAKYWTLPNSNHCSVLIDIKNSKRHITETCPILPDKWEEKQSKTFKGKSAHCDQCGISYSTRWFNDHKCRKWQGRKEATDDELQDQVAEGIQAKNASQSLSPGSSCGCKALAMQSEVDIGQDKVEQLEEAAQNEESERIKSLHRYIEVHTAWLKGWAAGSST